MLSNASGFSIIDIVISMAIMAILVTIASHNLDCMADSAHKSEAMLALGAIYQAEQTHFNEFNTYTMCILKIGYLPESGKRIYTVGFASQANSGTCGNGAQGCNRYEQGFVCNTANANYGANAGLTSDANVAANATSGAKGVALSFASMGGAYTCHDNGLVAINGVPYYCWGKVYKNSFHAVAYRGITHNNQPALQGYLINESKKVIKAKFDGFP